MFPIEEYVHRAWAEVLRLLVSAGETFWADTFAHLDPFWGYAFYVVLIIAACYLVAKFFDVLRVPAGVIALTAIAFLVGFWKGEKADKPKPKPTPKPSKSPSRDTKGRFS